ncbi:hypothetical protein GCM10009839_60040 [Catenulispora yoronensis]|uniref:Uncharacterized protein n=1 Tax=Catenulispora yoronensis TaxID=450799 RepID=A0ABP5GM65_9ACTN
MKKYWEQFLGLAVFAGLIALVASFVHVPGRTLLNVGLGAVSLYWLLILTTLPWNLYFRARQVRHEIGVSREREIRVPEGREAEVRRWERRLLVLALGGHVVTAAAVAALTYASGHVLGYYFAAFYLLSAVLRPVGAYLGYVKDRIASLLKETKFPRDDVQELTVRLETLTAEVEALRLHAGHTEEQTLRDLDSLRDSVRGTETRLKTEVRVAREAAEADRTDLRTRVEQAEQRVAATARHFEQAVDGLTDQRELLTGIRAFVRLVRTDAAAGAE